MNTIDTINTIARRWCEPFGYVPRFYEFRPARAASVRRFLQHLPASKVIELVNCALSQYPSRLRNEESCWRYFCGACWTAIREGASR